MCTQECMWGEPGNEAIILNLPFICWYLHLGNYEVELIRLLKVHRLRVLEAHRLKG